MAVLAADVNISAVGDTRNTQFSANGADTYFKGAIVYSDTGGGLQALPAAGDRCVGVIPYKQVVTAAGDEVEVIVEGLIWMPIGTANISAADEGDILCCDISGTLSDNPGDMVSAIDITIAANDIAVGRILRVTTTQMLIGITPGLTGSIGTIAAALQFD